MARERIDGFKQPIPQSLIERVWELVAAGMTNRGIAKRCGISEAKARAISDQKEIGWAKVVSFGRNADPGTSCPYGMSEIGLRCAWLAGHHDKHGREAWERARQ